MGTSWTHTQESSEEQLVSLANFTEQQTWTKPLQVWKDVLDFKGKIYSQEKDDKNEEINNAKKPKLEDDVPNFRCTCYRTGPNHKFRSNEAQIAVGGKIHDMYSWNPKMKDFDIEVVINCDIDQVYLAIALTNKSLFNRTMTHLGQVSLKPTISAALVRLAKAVPGDIVLDPMCGGGSIPLEGSLMNTGAYFLGGEIDSTGIDRCQKNLMGVTSKHNLPAAPPVDCFQWSALTPCLRDNSVDVIISDLPFGKRSGSKADNRVLYPNTMLALARLVRPDTGRAVLLTQDKTSMFKSFAKTKKYWKLEKFFGVNIGGLKGLVFLFNRTAELVAKLK